MSKLWSRWKLSVAKRRLESQIRRKATRVKIKRNGLTLISINPLQKSSCVVNGKAVEFHSSTWDGNSHFTFWGGHAQISLVVDGAQPTDQELELVDQIITHPRQIRSEIECGIFKYYGESVYQENATSFDGVPIPKPHEHDLIRDIINTPTIYPQSDFNDFKTAKLRMHFLPDWDDSGLGFCVYLDDWVVTETSFGS